MEYTVDPERYANISYRCGTGIYIYAKTEDGYDAVDLAVLDKQSLLSWLKQNNESNKIAEDTVGILLGHGHLN